MFTDKELETIRGGCDQDIADIVSKVSKDGYTKVESERLKMLLEIRNAADRWLRQKVGGSWKKYPR